MDGPISFESQMITSYFQTQPSEVIDDSRATDFHERYLYQKIFSCFDFKLPKGWGLNYFRYFIFHFGRIACVNTKSYSWVCGPFGVSAYSWDYRPKVITYANSRLPDLKFDSYTVGENACILHIFDDYRGLSDLVHRYATELADIDKSISINLKNCNATVAARAKNKKQAETIKAAYEEATEGKPLVVINDEALEEGDMFQFFPDIKSSYLVGDLLTARRTIINNFLTEIGIKNANYDKKERLNSQEVSQNNDEVSAIITVIYNNLKEGFEELAKLTGEPVSVSLHYNYSDSSLLEGGADVG